VTGWGPGPLYSRSNITLAISILLIGVATAASLTTAVAADAAFTSTSPVKAAEREHVASYIARTGTPARHRKNQTLSDFIANSRAWSLSDERSVNLKLDRNVSGSQKRQGLKLTGGIGPPHHLSMSGAIEADTERVLPRTGYIPTNEPTSLRAQGVTMGLEFHY
jgi:hypothetical protein